MAKGVAYVFDIAVFRAFLAVVFPGGVHRGDSRAQAQSPRAILADDSAEKVAG
jgi:hypothetical protein